MGNIYVISDLHFGHNNMALYRGFENVFEHDETIIKNWNNTVGRKDTVWILGDITMEKTKDYYRLDCLNGFKKVVLGNHDHPQHAAELLKYVNSVAGMVDYKGSVLTHCPIHPSELERYNKNIHGHCVDVETEILTKEGWKKYNEIKSGMIIYSYNPVTNILEYDKIEKVIINPFYDGKMYNLKGKGIDMLVSNEHRIPFKNKNNQYEVEIADDFFKRKTATLYKSFLFLNKGVELSDDLLKLYIYLAADGNITTTHLCRFSFKKERKISMVESLLTSLKIPFSRNESKGFTRINFRMPAELYNWNIKGLDKKLLEANRKQAEIIKESYRKTDGNRNLIFTSKISEVNILQQLFVLNGFSCKIYTRKGHGFTKHESYQLSVTDNLTQMIPNINIRVSTIDSYNNTVWCVSCKNKNFIARRKGGVFLTGNCHEHTLPDDRYVNICCEVVNYTPVLLKSLLTN